MAKISTLPANQAITGAETLPIVQGGVMRKVPLLDVLGAPGAADAMKIGGRSVTDAITAMPVEIAEKVVDALNKTWPDPNAGFATVELGNVFLAIAPDGSIDPVSGRVVGGQRRTYQRIAAPQHYRDLGDNAAPLSRGELSAAGGSPAVGYKAPGPALLRGVGSKLDENRSVLDFLPAARAAAIIDKTTTYDAGPELNLGFADVGPNCVLFPRGRFLTSTTLIPAAGQEWVGQGHTRGGSTSPGNVSEIRPLVAGAIPVGGYLVSANQGAGFTMREMILNGLDKTIHLLRAPVAFLNLWGGHLVSGDRGITGASGVSYMKNAHLLGGKISNCKTGIYGGIDSRIVAWHVIGCEDFGLRAPAGANDIQIAASKFDWNGVNIDLFQANNFCMTGGNLDRASTVGFRAWNCENFTVAGTQMRRNGRNGDPDQALCCHMKVGGGSVGGTITGVTTRIGPDDDGTGYVAPRVSLFLEGVTSLTATGNNLTGCTEDPIAYASGFSQDDLVLSGNVPGRANNMFQQRGSSMTADVPSGTLATGASIDIVLRDFATKSSDGYAASRKLIVSGRNQSTGNVSSAELPFVVRRGSAAASAVVSPLEIKAGTLFGSAGSVVTVTIASVSEDGSNVTVHYTNNAGVPVRLFAHIV